ncbi:E3 ubiquitin-protein ligase LRSAM1 isoform X2 [Halyomorpha halys]|uniref:E3 ubiquitin-protein ligase LRSAM1 isoform X2 n=1 Tax=Halyomorpha halys TaxID=286706 RepID=UPI0006D4DEB1|nr:E3 ubiquitin-protein ligase LRSAM1 isoform X2 [Halyomorpha halys]
MPFSKKDKVDYKARLEYKLYLAREDPDVVFDISDCDLKNVPKGIYSICKVLRKESLILKNNNLTSLSGGGNLGELSLLKILDIRSNNLSFLPESIAFLENLKELYLNNNLIKYLPEGIVRLKNLRILSVPFNKIKRLPPNIEELNVLEELYLQGNPALCILPNTLSLCSHLSKLVLDIGRYTHPPDDVVHQGTTAILTFLGTKIGYEYKGVQFPLSNDMLERKDSVKSNVTFDQQLQEIKQKECLALEKDLAEQKNKELQLQNELKKDKNKLVEDLKKQQMKIAEEVLKFQNKKEAEREKLIEHIKQAELEADNVIDKMLDMNHAYREPWSIFQQQEIDRASERLIFQQNLNGDLKKKEILSDMENLLKNERSKLLDYEEARAQTIKDSLIREAEWDSKVSQLLAAQERPLAWDTSEQEAAVAMLLERSDLESGRLRAQLGIIERQLKHLTAAEMKKARMDTSQITNELSEKRAQLSELLMDVLEQREARKSQLLDMLRRMEVVAHGEEDYWLVQYQKLLESQAVLDPALVRLVVLAGLPKHLPLLMNLDLNELTLDQLMKEGIELEEEAQAILKAVRSYLSDLIVPSAPFEEIPSAPSPSTEYESECVVCMAAQCRVVFVPCGHLCCCQPCSQQMRQCPLCRREIESKIHIIPS